MAEDEGGVSPEINSSTSQSEDPSLQLVRVLFLFTVILSLSKSGSKLCGGVCFHK